MKPAPPQVKANPLTQELGRFEASDWWPTDETLVKKHGPLLFFKENAKVLNCCFSTLIFYFLINSTIKRIILYCFLPKWQKQFIVYYQHQLQSNPNLAKEV
jgi:hypothetical protein